MSIVLYYSILSLIKDRDREEGIKIILNLKKKERTFVSDNEYFSF